VVAWGNNSEGQTTLPVAAQSGVTAIAAGNVHAVALKDDGSVVAWGGNYYGQVTGTPTTVDPYSAIASPVTLGGQVLTGVTAIAAGWAHTVALRNDGL
jgi:alpha-tubulin suppressor-like RCC1 family protein